MIFPKFSIYMEVTSHPRWDYRILETTMTSDGPRTRVCDGRWFKLSEAEEMLRKKQAEVEK